MSSLSRFPLDESQVRSRLAALCARREHCQNDLLRKMQQWGVDEQVQARVMRYLVDHQFVDEERYARAFVLDKVQHLRWGRHKVEQALYVKGIGEDIRRKILAGVSEEDFTERLRPLLQAKARQLSGEEPYARRAKLIRYALARGYTMQQALECIDDQGLS